MTPDQHPEHPWHQQPDEGPEAYQAFAKYLEQERADRSVRRVARELNKSLTLIGRWSSEHGWVRRIAAYDRHLDERRRREHEDEVVKMGRRQARQLEAAMQAVTQPVQELLRRIAVAREKGENPFAGLSMEQLQRAATAAMRHMPALIEAERLVAGLSTQNVNPDAAGSVEEARARAEAMSRGELESYLLGVDDGQRDALRRFGLEEELEGGDAEAS